MYTDLVPYLRCSSCSSQLALQQPALDSAGEVVAGTLLCAICGARYPVRAGVADFLDTYQPDSLAQLVNEWRLTAWLYERLWRPFALTLFSGEPFPYRRELPLIAGMVEPWRGGLYIDVACSNGLYTRALTRTKGDRPGHMVGVDHSFAMVAEARRSALAAGLRVSYVRAKAQQLPFASNVAAGVVIGGSLNEIGDLDACLAEVRRVLASDGRFIAMTLTRATTVLGRAIQWLVQGGGVRFSSTAQLLGRFGQCGLRTVGHWQYGVVLFTYCIVAGRKELESAKPGNPLSSQ